MHPTYSILKEDSTLADYDQNQFSDALGRSCVTINYQPFEIINEKGFCEDCLVNQYADFVNSKGRACVTKSCSKYEILTPDGVCQDCDKTVRITTLMD